MKTKKFFFLWAILLTILISTSRVEAQKKDISSQVTLANEFYHEKNYKAAADIFEKLIDQGETNGFLYYNLGNTYMGWEIQAVPFLITFEPNYFFQEMQTLTLI